MLRSRADLLPLFQAAENAFSPPVLPGVTLAERLNDWLVAEVAFRAEIGCKLVAQPSYPPREPYQLTLWEGLATGMRDAHLAEYGQQFLAREMV